MAESTNGPDLSNYVSVKEAADMLGISSKRVYAYIESRRLEAFKPGRDYFISKEAVKQFALKTAGRPREKTPLWRIYTNNVTLVSLAIEVEIRPNQQDAFAERMERMYENESHLFTGTIQRYVLKDKRSPHLVNIWLFWKDIDMSDEKTSEQELAAFKAELADVLDWDTAQYSHKEGIIYT